MNEVSVEFRRDELWHLQSNVPDEFSPYAQVWDTTALRSQVEHALVLCERADQDRAHIVLNETDCKWIQKITPLILTSPLGEAYGRSIILKVMEGRMQLQGALMPFGTSPARENYHSKMKPNHEASPCS